MKSRNILALSSLAAVATAQNTTTNPAFVADATNCVSGAHIIVARASGEADGYGILGIIKDQLLSRIPNSNAVAVPYPATIYKPLYLESEPNGVGNMTKLVMEYGDACPGHKMVLMGYSQGAHVVGDTVIGSSNPGIGSFPNTTGLSKTYLDNIVALVMMGDPANVANVPINKGNSTHNGTFPRGNTAKWTSLDLVNRTVSYCDAGDLYCDGGSSLAVHLGYVFEYGKQAADFVVQRVAAANTTSASGSNPSSSSGSPSTSASGSASPSATKNAGSTLNGVSSLVPGLSSYTVIGAIQCIFAATLLLVV